MACNTKITRTILLSLCFGLGACDYGGGGGGGPAQTPLPPRPAYHPPAPLADAAARGAAVFKREGCVLCHGQAGAGGVANPNSDTGGKINGLTLVKEGYSAVQLKKKITEGVVAVNRKDPRGPEPPLRMPVMRARLPEGEIADLVAYLMSLYPKGRKLEDDWDEDDDDDADPEPGGSPSR